nr:Hint domain-containing protein [Pseudohalocynthiibacter aestuariivivens]
MTGTRVATRAGWCPIESVCAGTEVLTFDASFQEVRDVQRAPLWADEAPCPQHLWPLEVPAGVLGNRDALLLMPEQPIMIEIDAAEELFGDPFALIPVRALDGICGISRTAPELRAMVTSIRFDAEQIVFANSGAMFLCASAMDLLDVAMSDDAPDQEYTVLPMGAAQQLAALLGTAIQPEMPLNWPEPEKLAAHS